MSKQRLSSATVTSLTGAAFETASALCSKALARWLKIINQQDTLGFTIEDHEHYARSFIGQAIADEARSLIRASKIPASALDADQVASELRLQESSRIADQFAEKKVELRRLSKRVNDLRRKAQHFMTFEDIMYPPVPQPSIAPSLYGDGLPESSGIYFVWEEGLVVYVGQSINLKRRANLTHLKIGKTDVLSFVLCRRENLDFTECHYIGKCRPLRNFSRQKTLKSVPVKDLAA